MDEANQRAKIQVLTRVPDGQALKNEYSFNLRCLLERQMIRESWKKRIEQKLGTVRSKLFFY